jgi:hypothetical protein
MSTLEIDRDRACESLLESIVDLRSKKLNLANGARTGT